MFPNINEILTSNPLIEAIVGNRVTRHGEAFPDSQAPYITWFMVDMEPENTLACSPDTDKMIIQLDIRSMKDPEVVNLTKLVRTTMETHGYVTGMPINTRDEKTRLYHIALQFEMFYARE